MKWILIALMAAKAWPVFGQGLANIPPVLADHAFNNSDTTTSFILNAIDFHRFFKQQNAVYGSCIEIVDADNSWPPRWYTSTGLQIADSIIGLKDIYMDANFQNGFVTFYNEEELEYPSHREAKVAGFIICNKKMEPIDTFNVHDRSINFHEFRINANGEKLVMVKLDTVIDIRRLSRIAQDRAVKTSVDLIQIYDSNNKLIFQWNPVKSLGVDAFYYPYRFEQSYSKKTSFLDWSHGNSVSWDFDGNIIYSFRHVGIGKVSSKDGHVIWRLDRNKMPYFLDSDTIAFYMQHGLEAVSYNENYITYALYSNGDNEHLGAYGLQFRVNKNDSSVHFVKRKMPDKNVISLSSGNYEVQENGDYLLNYGVQVLKDGSIDTTAYRAFLEYGNKSGYIYGKYGLPELTISFRVQRLYDWRPPRPTVTLQNNALVAQGEMKEWLWYYLSGKDNTIVIQVGNGQRFTPSASGKYCVAGKFGLGYSVSLPFNYKL